MFQKFENKEDKMVVITIFIQLLSVIKPSVYIFDYVFSMIEDNFSVSAKVYEFLTGLTVNSKPSIDSINQALTDLSCVNVNVCRWASKFLLNTKNLSQSEIVTFFGFEKLEFLQRGLRIRDAEVLKNLVLLCEVLLENGLTESFVSAGCLNALSTAYFHANAETSNKIDELIARYFEFS